MDDGMAEQGGSEDLTKKLKQLNQLYGLYSKVDSYTRAIRDVLWIGGNFREIETIMTDFQAQDCRLPADRT